MSVIQASYFCPHCQQRRLFTQQTMNHTPHILASVFLCGLWLPVWLLTVATYDAGFHCSQCGFSDALKYLGNPLLRQQEAKNRQLQQEAKSKLLQQPSFLSQWLTSPKNAWKIVAIVLGVFAIFSGIIYFSSPPKSPPIITETLFSPSNSFNLQKQIRARLGVSSPKWENLIFNVIEEDSIRIYLNYAQMPSSMSEVEVDTARIVQTVIDELVAQKYSPKDKQLRLIVYARKREPRKSGVDIIRDIGNASYDFKSDKIVLSEDKGIK